MKGRTIVLAGALCLGLSAGGTAHGDAQRAVAAFKARNFAEAEREARAAIANGDGRGYEILAGLFLARDDKKPDIDSSIATLQDARKAGHLRAGVVLAHLLRHLKWNGEYGEDESFKVMLDTAERGFPPAQYFVAKEYELLFIALQRPGDRASALRWFGEAAKSRTSLEMENWNVTGQQIHCDVASRIETSEVRKTHCPGIATAPRSDAVLE